MKIYKKNTAQVTLEFTFSMIIILIMMFTLIKIFLWTGRDLADRRIEYDKTLTKVVFPPMDKPLLEIVTGDENYTILTAHRGPLRQLDPNFFSPGKLDAVWDGDPNIFKSGEE